MPEIAYTPENYTVQFHGLDLQSEVKHSEEIVGTTDILATNLSYTVMLTELEEANKYSYTVQASNCNGTTSTEARNFTTHPDCVLSQGQSSSSSSSSFSIK